MIEITGIIIISILLSIGAIVISYRYVQAKAKAEEQRLKLEREALVQVYRRD